MAPVAVKVEQSETKMSTEGGDSLKQTITIVDHKIRNLEKRKRKIEIYREDQGKGQVLNADQLAALAKYGEVVQSLELAHELRKQFETVVAEATRQARRQQKREAAERAARELARVKEVLVLQDVMQNMGLDEVRADFLAGSNGAAAITSEDLGFLDEVYEIIFPKHSTAEEELPPFQEQATLAAEHILSILEGRPKEVAGTTYKHLKDLIAKIAECGYLDRLASAGYSAPAAPTVAAPEYIVSAEEGAGDYNKPPAASTAPATAPADNDNKYAEANNKWVA